MIMTINCVVKVTLCSDSINNNFGFFIYTWWDWHKNGKLTPYFSWLHLILGRLTQTGKVWKAAIENVLFSGNSGCWILQAKEEGPACCYRRTVRKATSAMVRRCSHAHDKWNLHICEGPINADLYLQVSGKEEEKKENFGHCSVSFL